MKGEMLELVAVLGYVEMITSGNLQGIELGTEPRNPHGLLLNYAERGDLGAMFQEIVRHAYSVKVGVVHVDADDDVLQRLTTTRGDECMRGVDIVGPEHGPILDFPLIVVAFPLAIVEVGDAQRFKPALESGAKITTALHPEQLRDVGQRDVILPVGIVGQSTRRLQDQLYHVD